MRGLAIFLFILFAAPGAALAQGCGTSQLSCQALAAQDATAAGIPANVFQAQIQAESGFNPNIGCNAAGACGIAQFIPGTAAQFGIDPTDPVAALQAAAQYDAQLVAQTGSLTGALTAYSGGCTPANPCNAAYAQAFQLAAADAAGGGGGVGGDTLTPADPGAAPPAAASASALSFEWIYNAIVNGIINQVADSILTVQNLVTGPALSILALAIAIMGFMTLFGNMDMGVFLAFAIRAALVMTFIQPNSTYFNQWVENLVLGIPQYFSNAFDVSGGTGATPAQIFDQILNGWTASTLTVWHSSGWSLHALFVGLTIALLTIIIVLPTLVAMFTVFLISTFLLLVMLTIGPLMILALLFQVTRRFFHSYVSVLVTMAIFALVVDIVLGIFSTILTGIMATFTPSDSPTTDLPGLFGLAGAMLVTGFSMARLPRLVESIGGGVAVGLDSVGRFASGGFAADLGVAGARIAARTL